MGAGSFALPISSPIHGRYHSAHHQPLNKPPPLQPLSRRDLVPHVLVHRGNRGIRSQPPIEAPCSSRGGPNRWQILEPVSGLSDGMRKRAGGYYFRNPYLFVREEGRKGDSHPPNSLHPLPPRLWWLTFVACHIIHVQIYIYIHNDLLVPSYISGTEYIFQ